MTDGDNFGTVAERQRRRRYWTLMGLATAAALVLGVAGRILGTPYGPIDPAAAIGLAAALLLLMLVGNWVYFRNIDELEVASNLVGGFWGFYTFIIGWPLWHILWRGGLVPKPEMLPLYIAAALIAVVGFLWKRFQ
jgi:hypothetical protein